VGKINLYGKEEETAIFYGLKTFSFYRFHYFTYYYLPIYSMCSLYLTGELYYYITGV